MNERLIPAPSAYPHLPKKRQLAASDLAAGKVLAQREAVLDQALFDQFALLTGDAHPIHYDAGYAESRGLEAPIAHGLLLVAMSALGATTLSERLHDSMIAMTNMSADFMAPVFVGTAIQLVFRVGQIEPASRGRSKVRFDVDLQDQIQSGDKLYCRVFLHFLLHTELKGPHHASLS